MRLWKKWNTFFKDTRKPYKFEWIALFVTMFIVALCFTYNDIIVTTRHGIRFWDVLFQGKPLEFYNYNVAAATGNSVYNEPQGAAYDFTIYIIFAGWNFPLWLLEHFFHVPATENMFCLMYSKLLLLVFIGLTAKALMNIAETAKMPRNTQLWMTFCWLSSILLFSSTLMISQYDILSLCFMLWGVNAYLKNNNVKFILFFMLAVSCKYFALLIFIPLVLLRFKKVLHILVISLSSMSLSVFWWVLFSFAGSAHGAGGLGATNSLLPSLVGWRLPGPFGYIPVFVLSMGAICLWAYLQKADPERALPNTLFICCASMLAFICESDMHPYWVVLATPFLMLLAFSNPVKIKINLLLEMGLSACLVFLQWIAYDWCFCNKLLVPMLLGGIFGKGVNIDSGASNFLKLLASRYPIGSILSTAMLCFAAFFLYLNHPRKVQAVENCELHIERSVIWLRYAACAFVAGVPMLYYILCAAGILGV